MWCCCLAFSLTEVILKLLSQRGIDTTQIFQKSFMKGKGHGACPLVLHLLHLVPPYFFLYTNMHMSTICGGDNKTDIKKFTEQ